MTAGLAKLVVVLALLSTVALLVRAGVGKKREARAGAPAEPAGADTVSVAAGPWLAFEKPTDQELRTKLDPVQYKVACEGGTEPPFRNAYWDNHEPGIYVDVVSGEPLFSSLDKFDSGTGWPSFTRPLVDENVTEKEDRSLLMNRTEVRSVHGDSHLGHVFDDGPEPSGLRYCINSASLRFIPADSLEEAGYPEYAALFQKSEGVAAAPQGVAARDTGSATAVREAAILAGGCFWGMEDLIREIPGVLDTEVGYTGGTLENPRYEDTHDGKSGHAEAIRVVFDPSRLSYEDLLGFFFRMHDPTTLNRQGNDRGSQYRSAIFYADEAQRKTAERVKEQVNTSGKWKNPVVTEIVPAGPFYRAEDYHQDYLAKNPGGYTCHYYRD